MDLMGLLILLLPALATPSLAASREYILIHDKRNWIEAQSYCREKFHDLATIESEDDWNTVRDMLISQDVEYVYTGLYEAVDTWRWTLDNASLVDLGSWFYFEANNGEQNSYCAYATDGGVYDKDCEVSYPSVCYDESSDSLFQVSTAMEWHSAQSYCRQTHTELASLRTQQEWDAVMSIVGSSRHWVGLTRDNWLWSDQSPCQFRIWESGEPDDWDYHCGTARFPGLGDSSCTSDRRFLCSVPIMKVARVVLKIDDPNDPQVQESALKKMEQQLKEKGIHQQFRLSWRRQQEHGQVFKKIQLSEQEGTQTSLKSCVTYIYE